MEVTTVNDTSDTTDNAEIRVLAGLENSAVGRNDELAKTQEEFEKFVKVIEDDLRVKTDRMKTFKKAETVARKDKNYASLQLFMLAKYMNRVNRFKEVNAKSLDAIQEEVEKKDGSVEKIGDLVATHVLEVSKMKRRMKHILDVSEKYAVIDTDINNVPDNFLDDIDTDKVSKTSSMSLQNLEKRNSMDSNSSDEDFSLASGSPHSSPGSSPMPPMSEHSSSLSVPSLSTSPSSRPSSISPGPVKSSRNTFRSLTDHMTVLTKTYTNRR